MSKPIPAADTTIGTIQDAVKVVPATSSAVVSIGIISPPAKDWLAPMTPRDSEAIDKKTIVDRSFVIETYYYQFLVF